MKSTLSATFAVILALSACPVVFGGEAAPASDPAPRKQPETSPAQAPPGGGEPARPDAASPSSPAPPGSGPPSAEVRKQMEQARLGDERARALIEAARAHPESISHQTEMLAGLLELGKIDEALDAAPTVVERFPRSAAALALFGRILVRNGEFDLSRLQFQRALALDGKDPRLHEEAAWIELMRGDLKKAETGFRAALAIDPSRVSATNGLVTVLERTGRFAEAIKALGGGTGASAERAFTGRRSLLPELARQAPVRVPASFTQLTLPMLLAHGFPPVVEARFGDVLEGRLVVDTNSEEMVLSPDAARALGLPEKGTGIQTDSEGHSYPTAAHALVDRVAMGSLVLERVPVRVSPGLKFPDSRIVGMIGADILRRFHVVMDYPAKTLTLSRPSGNLEGSVPFVLAGGILVDGTVGHKPVGKFVIDPSSSTPGAMDIPFVSRETGLTFFSEGVRQVREGEGHALFKFTMPAIEVAGVEFRKFPATAIDLRLLQRRIGVNVRGIIGQSLLRDCRLEIDFKAQRLVLKRTRMESPGSESPAGPPQAAPPSAGVPGGA